jgi:hypothetical protein
VWLRACGCVGQPSAGAPCNSMVLRAVDSSKLAGPDHACTMPFAVEVVPRKHDCTFWLTHTRISCPDHWLSGSCAGFDQITSPQAGMARIQLAKALVVWEAIGSKSGAAYQPHVYRNK